MAFDELTISLSVVFCSEFYSSGFYEILPTEQQDDIFSIPQHHALCASVRLRSLSIIDRSLP
jgi:hypothetical protein